LSFVTHGIELTRLTQFVTIMRIEKLLSSNTMQNSVNNTTPT